jgi:hypothetical protein
VPAAVSAELGCRQHEVWEAVWGLVADGLVYLDTEGQGSGTDSWRWKLSAAGVRVVEGGPWEPREPEGYLRRLRRQVPELDPLALRYVEEALRAFNAHCYLATSVMLGVASEAVFNRLAAAFVTASEGSAAKLEKLIDDPSMTYFARFVELRKRLDPIRDSLPNGLGDVLTPRLSRGPPAGDKERRRAPERAVDRRGHRPNAPAHGRAVPREDDRTAGVLR